MPQVYAVDSSSHALAYARANVARLEVQDAVTVCEGSWCDFEGASKLVARCGVLVSNPPYIPSHKVAGLQPEVSRCGQLSPFSALSIRLGRVIP